MKLKTLSDKIGLAGEMYSNFTDTDVIAKEDVKEFIKRLLDWAEHFKGKDIPWNWVIGKIKFEAGGELT